MIIKWIEVSEEVDQKDVTEDGEDNTGRSSRRVLERKVEMEILIY